MSSKPHVRKMLSPPHHARKRAIASGNGTPDSRSTASLMPVRLLTFRFIFLKYLGWMRIWNSSATVRFSSRRTAPICTISPRMGEGSGFFAV